MRKELKTVLFGIVAALAIGGGGALIGTATKIPGPDSEETLLKNRGELSAIAHGIPPTDNFIAILANRALDVQDTGFIEARESLVVLLREQTSPSGEKLLSGIKTLGHTWMHENLFVSQDGHHLLVSAESAVPVYRAPQSLQNLAQRLREWQAARPEFSLQYSSSGIVSNELFSLINEDLDKSLRYTIPITVIILLWTFRSIASALITLALTGLSLGCSLGIAAILSRLIEPISATAAQLIVLLVMAVGTDYALFFITRVRQEVWQGASYARAVALAKQTTGVAIFWSGLTVAVSLTGLLLAGDSILTSMAVVSIVAVVVTLFYILRILPALILLLQSKIEWGKLRGKPASHAGRANNWILWSTRRPKVALFCSGSLLILLGLFCIPMKLGSTMQPDMLPKQMQSSAAARAIAEFFPKLAGTDLSIILSSPDLADRESSGALQDFLDHVQSNDRIRGPSAIQWSGDQQAVRYKFSVQGTSRDAENGELLHRIKNDLLPRLAETSGISGSLSGKLVYDIEQEEMYRKKIVLVLASILLVSFIFLLVAFESIVIPLKALLLNLLSSAAAFGLLVLFFQMYGWRYGVIESFVPSLLFAVLFGLSMDYHLFLLSTIQEEVRNGAPTTSAVRAAIAKTYGVISSAAIVMASVFVVISMLELPLMKQLGLGLASAVILDATVIRCVLLPASVVLLGDLNWYMPRALKKAVRSIKLRGQRNLEW